MTRRVDENWRVVQEETLRNWLNSVLKGPLSSSTLQVENLSEDLKDARFITLLLNNLTTSGRQVKIRNKNPRLPVQMRENLASCFEFIEEENIKLVNIGKLVL